MVDLLSLLTVQDTNLNNVAPIDDMEIDSQMNFSELLFQAIDVNISPTNEESAKVIDENLSVVEENLVPISNSIDLEKTLEDIDSNDSIEDTLEANNAIAWINFSEFQSSQLCTVEKSTPAPSLLEKHRLQPKQINVANNNEAKSVDLLPENIAQTPHEKSTELELISKLLTEFLPAKRQPEVQSTIDDTVVGSLEEGSEKTKPALLVVDVAEIEAPVSVYNPMVSKEQSMDVALPILTPTILELPMNPQEPDWGEKFSQHVMWLGQQNIKSAVIKLNPQELGPLEININTENLSTSINIVSHNAEIREILGQTIPELRQMMLEQGINLLEVNIDSQSESRHSHNANNQVDSDNIDTEKKEVENIAVTPKKLAVGLIDYFA